MNKIDISLTKTQFIDIASKGIKIDLYENYVEDYIQNLMKFLEDLTNYYVDEFDTEWCEICKAGTDVLKVVYEKDRVMFYMPQEDLTPEQKSDVGHAIKSVYMHSKAWEAINNDGKISPTIEPWPI